MSGVSVHHWPRKVQRFIGKGALLDVVAVHSKRTHLPVELIESWYEYAIAWIKGFCIEPKAFAFIGVEGFEDATSYAFDKADKKFRKRGFTDVPYIGMEAAPPPGTVWLTFRQPLVGISISCTSFTPEGGTPRGGSKIVWRWEHDRRIFSKEAWSQESSATRLKKMASSSVIASSGVFQPSVFLGRPLRSRAMSFSWVWVTCDRSMPLGRN